MFDKIPNYHFSRQKDREISSTEAQINKIRHRVSSITKKRVRNQAWRTVYPCLTLSLAGILRSMTLTIIGTRSANATTSS
jgi:hypothetical protein